MTLASLAPNLDDRTFQDMVDEAKRLIPRYCPEWTDHNVSDPGVAMIELFAYLTEGMIFRLNQVPDKTHIHFLDMIGVELMPAQAAVADVTFTLSAPQPAPVRIPEGTEVATVRTPDWEAITFSTTETLELEPANMISLQTSTNGAQFVERRDRLLGEGLAFEAFERTPKPGNAWYLGFAGNLSRHTIRLRLQADQGTGPNPEDTPLVWEAWLGEDAGWSLIEIEEDTSKGLLRAGVVVVHLPASMLGATLGDKRARSWLRARVIETSPGQYPYDRTPRILAVAAETIGGSAPARHAERIRNEPVGFGDETPGQSFQLNHTPVLPRRAGEFLEVGDGDGGWIPWIEVLDYSTSGPDDPHYTLDSATGIISFGPAIHEPDGSVRQHGAIPPEGTPVRFSSYHTGGGTIGNVGQHRLAILKSSLSYVAGVSNRYPATGGADVESIEHAKMRAGAWLRTRDRAVTADDFETLAMLASSAVARACCLDPSDFPPGSGRSAPKIGTVVVAILPSVASPDRPLEPDELRPPAELIKTVRDFLDERRLITTMLDVRPARIIRVAVQATVACHIPAQTEHIRARVEQALYQLLNPVTSGPDGFGGWPFGRDLSIYDVHAAIQRVPGIELIADVRLSVVDDRGRSRDAGARVAVPPDTVIASDRHLVTVGGRRR
ncbi:MAG: putative baseplate assembly protein [Thermomicrobiales bacterium]